MLHSKYEQYGEIYSAAVALDNKWKSRGLGHVTYLSESAAHIAVQSEKDANIQRPNPAKQAGKPTDTSDKPTTDASKGINLFIKNLHHSVDQQEFSDLVNLFGKTTSVKLMVDN